jgi:NTE family protein
MKSTAAKRVPDDQATRVLVLQGGGALGSYQAGIYEALAESEFPPTWLAGISIGAVNAAIIAGNAPNDRVARLREFWELATSTPFAPPPIAAGLVRSWWNEASAAWVSLVGAPGFFEPRIFPAALQKPGSLEALSIYETKELKATLERLVDFDRINARETRLSVGAVNVRTGNFTYFDNEKQRLGPEHIMASGALPPGFPPIEIDGEFYWDGGLVSNTPLQYILDETNCRKLLICQVDLFPARGPLPTTLAGAIEREKDIRYSSRTRLNTDQGLALHRARTALRKLLKRLPPELLEGADIKLLHEVAHEPAVTVVQFIYRRKAYESHSKDYEFSRASMLEHWAAGRSEVEVALKHPEWVDTSAESGTAVYDFSRNFEILEAAQ